MVYFFLPSLKVAVSVPFARSVGNFWKFWAGRVVVPILGFGTHGCATNFIKLSGSTRNYEAVVLNMSGLITHNRWLRAIAFITCV